MIIPRMLLILIFAAIGKICFAQKVSLCTCIKTQPDSSLMLSIYIRADGTPFQLGDGPVYFEYDTTIFPAELINNGLITYQYADTNSILNQKIGVERIYSPMHLTDQTAQRWGMVWELNQNLSDSAVTIANEWKQLALLVIQHPGKDTSGFYAFTPFINHEIYQFDLASQHLVPLELSEVITNCSLTLLENEVDGDGSHLNISPNPASNEINVKTSFPFPPTQVQLVNMQGQVLAELTPQKVSGLSWKISLPEVVSGVYLLRWLTSSESISTRLVITQP